ncbi:hypothetical protein D3C85_1206510 [compost metagenome]
MLSRPSTAKFSRQSHRSHAPRGARERAAAVARLNAAPAMPKIGPNNTAHTLSQWPGASVGTAYCTFVPSPSDAVCAASVDMNNARAAAAG